MIKVDRSDVKMPGCLEPGQAGDKEMQRAVNFYATKGNKNKKFESYTVYGKKEIKARLNQLFYKKCAYCEMPYGGAPLDTEHFRPKGWIDYIKVDGTVAQIRPGYYWLAATWTNLLPSCIDCNRGREQDDAGSSTVGGKENFFPVAPGYTHVTAWRGDIGSEKRLLINPCEDDPEKLLIFHEDGTVTPKYNSGLKYLMADASIFHYALWRGDLIQARKRHAILLKDLLIDIAEDLYKLRIKKSKKIEARLRRHTTLLQQEYLEPKHPFMALTKTLIRTYLGTVDISSV